MGGAEAGFRIFDDENFIGLKSRFGQAVFIEGGVGGGFNGRFLPQYRSK